MDASPSMMTFARRVAKSAADEADLRELGEGMGFLSRPSGRPLPEPHPWGESGAVRTVASLRALHSKATFDLVVAAYALGEFFDARRRGRGIRPRRRRARGNRGSHAAAARRERKQTARGRDGRAAVVARRPAVRSCWWSRGPPTARG